MNNIKNAVSNPGAQIDDFAARVLLSILTGIDMSTGQIDDVDIIPDAGSVRRIIVIAEDIQMIQQPPW